MNSLNGQGKPIMLCSSSFTGQPLHDTRVPKVVSSIDAKIYFACIHQAGLGSVMVGFVDGYHIVNLGKLAISVYQADRQRFLNF
jgi:hypothetical protein